MGTVKRNGGVAYKDVHLFFTLKEHNENTVRGQVAVARDGRPSGGR